MGEESKNTNGNGSKIFGFSVRDFVVLFTLFAGLFLGNNFIGGTPRGAADELSDQIKEMKKDFMEEMDQNREERQANADNIKKVNARLDTINTTLINGLRGLDGYHQHPKPDSVKK